MHQRNVSWSDKYALLFLESPVGTGYSRSNNFTTCIPQTLEDVVHDLHIALKHFFQNVYPAFAHRDLYIASESYGGKWIPALGYSLTIDEYPELTTHPTPSDFTAASLSLSAEIKAMPPLSNFRGAMIGDGLTHPITQVATHAESAYALGMIGLVEKQKAEQMQEEVIQRIHAGDWLYAGRLRSKLLHFISRKSGGLKVDYGAYYADNKPVHETWPNAYRYFNLPATKQALHANTSQPFRSCLSPILPLISKNLHKDKMKSTKWMLPPILAKHRVLLYQAEFDTRDGPMQIDSWLPTLEWKYMSEFMNGERQAWYLPGGRTLGGFFRSFKTLTRIVVAGSGHMVPLFEPLRALDMLSHFIENVPYNSVTKQAHLQPHV
jgi:vitellogenic carboxypeptidase-like protein